MQPDIETVADPPFRSEPLAWTSFSRCVPVLPLTHIRPSEVTRSAELPVVNCMPSSPVKVFDADPGDCPVINAGDGSVMMPLTVTVTRVLELPDELVAVRV